MFIRQRTVHTSEWTDGDTTLAMALEDYEAQCDGRGHYLPETTKDEHADAYRADEPVVCWRCKAEDLAAEVAEKRRESQAGVLTSIVLDPDRVALNLLPKPPLPPELHT